LNTQPPTLPAGTLLSGGPASGSAATRISQAPDEDALRTTWFPLLKAWRSLILCSTLWTSFAFFSYWSAGRLTTPWILLNVGVSPAVQVGAIALLSPLPWVAASRFRKPWGFLLGLVIGLPFCMVLAAAITRLDLWFLSLAHVPTNPQRILAIYLSLVAPGMLAIGNFIAGRAQAESLREASDREARRIRHRLLQSQVHPHVLFNALTGMAELVRDDPRAAEEAILHLSDLMRKIIKASDSDRAPLREERKLVEDYLALESMRLGPRLEVAWDWDEALDALELPPLLLQPLAENAIKHGVAPSVEGGLVRVTGKVEGGALVLAIWNGGSPCDPEAVRRGTGIGVGNLQSRLRFAYGHQARLSLGPWEGGTRARIEIPMDCLS